MTRAEAGRAAASAREEALREAEAITRSYRCAEDGEYAERDTILVGEAIADAIAAQTSTAPPVDPHYQTPDQQRVASAGWRNVPPHPDPAEEIARLKKALEPFARAGDPLETVEEWEAYCRSSGMVYSFPAEDTDPIQDWKNELTVGDLRRARAALSGSRSPQTNELDKVRNLICEYWDADEQANAHRTICDLHDVLFPNNPTIRRKQRAALAESASAEADEVDGFKAALSKAFVVTLQDEGGNYMGDISAKAVLAMLACPPPNAGNEGAALGPEPKAESGHDRGERK